MKWCVYMKLGREFLVIKNVTAVEIHHLPITMMVKHLSGVVFFIIRPFIQLFDVVVRTPSDTRDDSTARIPSR